MISKSLRPLLIVGGTLIVLVSLVHWGGTATPGPVFVLGVAVLTGLILAFGLLTWWLYLSPMPAQPDRPAARSAEARQLTAALVVISGILFVIGGFWDELWHRLYGVVDIDDFFWPPHLLIYSSMGLMSLFAGSGLFLALRGSGNIRQRFRAEPLLGLLGLVSLYLAASAPSDLVWHAIYGLDITAWSLPHVLLGGGFTLVMLVAVALQLSLAPLHAWSRLRGLRGPEFLALVLIALGSLVLVQIGATEWDGITAIGQGGANDAFWSRPEWLYPVVITAISIFISAFALHVLRRAGAASVVALLVLGVRLILLAVFNAGEVGMGFFSHLLLLPPLIALDVWYALRLRRAEELGTLVVGSLAAAVAILAVGLPLVAAGRVYPRITGDTLPGMIGFGLATALVAGWAGARLGGWLGVLDRRAGAADHAGPRAIRVGIGALAAAILLVTVFIVTAQPPI